MPVIPAIIQLAEIEEKTHPDEEDQESNPGPVSSIPLSVFPAFRHSYDVIHLRLSPQLGFPA